MHFAFETSMNELGFAENDKRRAVVRELFIGAITRAIYNELAEGLSDAGEYVYDGHENAINCDHTEALVAC